MALGQNDSSRQINRAPSPIIARAVPWLVIVFGSVLQTLPMIASAPLLPPFGFLFLLAWRQLRPGLLPVWAGLPLGLIDDLYSGQPMGSAMLLWSLAMIGMELIEQRFPWRSYLLDWAVAAGIVSTYLVLASVIAYPGGGTTGVGPHVGVLAPQLLLSILVFPAIERVIALCDRLRLSRFRVVG